MKHITLLFLLVATLAYADDNVDHTMINGGAPGTVTDRAGMAGEAGSTTQSPPDRSTEQAKLAIGPHALTTRTSLESALAQLKGLRGQLELSQAEPEGRQEPMFLDQAKRHSKELTADVHEAVQSQKLSSKGVKKKYPSIAASSQFKDWESAIDELRTASQSWRGKSAAPNYWRDRDQAKTDLKTLEDRISSAIDKTDSFASSELKLSRSSG